MKNRSGFTLIELLVVIAIMGVLVALLAGGIKNSMENAKKRKRSTEIKSMQTAIMTYWHDTGKPPISIQSGKYVYTYTEDNNDVFSLLLNKDKNAVGKTYLDMGQLRTSKNGRVQPMESPNDPVADYKGDFYKVTIDLKDRNASVE